MKLNRIYALLLVLGILIPMTLQAQSEAPSTEDTPKSGLSLSTENAFEGYTLYAPLIGSTAYLLDINGEIVKTWEFDVPTAQALYLLDNGNLLYQSNAESKMLEQFGQVGGVAGSIKEYTWDGELVWSFDYAGDTYQQHHDIEPMPNGNILLIAWEVVSKEEALAAGMRPDQLPDGDTLWPDHVVEIDPQTNEIVWKWRAWDHLIQDYDPDLPNYGVVSEYPERIDINYNDQRVLGDWQHSNSIDYNPELDQIVLSVRHFSEIWIIDHSTTIEEAAGSTGGRSGMGGDLLYRWGNPAAYQAGTKADQQLFYQHDANWIPEGYPGAGNLTIFNNGDDNARPYSTVVEITPPLTEAGTYERDGAVYGPEAPIWEFAADPPERFYAPFISGAQRLPNGNTLILNGNAGHFLEVSADGEILWDYVNGFEGNLPETGYFGPTSVFRAYRYPADHPALVGRDLPE